MITFLWLSNLPSLAAVFELVLLIVSMVDGSAENIIYVGMHARMHASI